MEITAYIHTNLLGDLHEFSWLRDLDSVYLGEIFCERREDPDLIISTARKIRSEGKKVYIMTPIMPTDEQDLKKVHNFFELAEEGVFDAVCVNDAGALQIGLEEFPSVQLYAGSYLGIRNYRSAKVLEDLGIRRIAAPHDLPMDEVRILTENTKVEIEVFVHGSIPLLVSKRCLLLRNLEKEEDEPCGLLCRTLRGGVPIATLDEDEPLLMLGGRTAYSSKTYCLLEHISLIKSLGCAVIRIEEWNSIHPEIYRAYRKAVSDERVESLDAIKRLSANGLCNGWFFRKAGYLYEQGKNNFDAY